MTRTFLPSLRLLATLCLLAVASPLSAQDPRGWDPASGDGSSPEKAVVITEKSSLAGIDAEYRWVAEMRPGWSVQGQALIEVGGRMFDVLTVTDGKRTEDIYFDINGFFGNF